MSSVIEISDVTYRYQERVALKNISFSVENKELFALVGPNGSGKSTLFRLLSTLSQPQTGSILLFGKDSVQSASEIRSQIGVVFQTLSLDKKLTARENLHYAGRIFGLSNARIQQKTDELLNLMGLTDRADEFVEKLSGGLKRRLDIARSLMHSPQLLLMDEPSAGLDPAVRRELMEFLKRVQSQGVTIVLVTHHLDEVQTCTRIAFLNEGSLVALTSPKEVVRQLTDFVSTMQAENPKALIDVLMERFSLQDLESFFIEKTGKRWCLN